MSQADCAVVVLISGHGSNLQALIDAATPPVRIAAVIANRAEAYGLERARQAGIATQITASMPIAKASMRPWRPPSTPGAPIW